jgi:hypothetical protein
MKKIIVLITGVLLTLQGFAQKDNDTIIANNPANLKLKVLYFHITNRCNTCRSIEANIRKTLNDHFKNEMETGVVDLYVLNCELPENKDLVKKYDAYGATLALTAVQKGKEIKTEDLTTWAFQKAHSPEVFVAELKSKIEDFLK